MKKLLFTVIAVLSAFMAYAQTSIKVEVHRVVSVGEQFNLTFVIEGENAPSDFTWASTDDFQVLWGPQSGRSTSISIVNGKRTKSVQSTYTYVLRASSAGVFTIPSATAKAGGSVISSGPVKVEVVSDQAQPSSQASSSSSKPDAPSSSEQSSQQQDIFLDLAVSRSSVVVGEPIIATLKLYQRVNVAGFDGVSFPTFNGFWSQELEAPKNIEFTRETYKGQIYNAALLRKFVLIPQQKGKLTIDPAELVCLVQVRVSPGGASIFDGFFDEYRTIREKVTSRPVNIEVKPLPPGAPESFGGGVGKFEISASLSRTELKAHEAASLIVVVSGQGNVSLLQTPKVNFPPDVEVYDVKISDKIAPGGLNGSKVYEFPFIPRSHGEFEIEPVKYSYYDVGQHEYVTLQTEPVYMTVLKGEDNGGGSASVMVPGKTDVRNIGTDIRFINVKDSRLAASGIFFVGSLWFWISLALIFVLAAILWVVFRKVASRRADVAGTRNRKATKMALRRLRLAETFLKQNLYTAFYEELHKALLGFVSDKLNMPVTDLSRDRIAEVLTSSGVSAGDVDMFIDILDACEYARYAPGSGNEAMAAHYNSAIEVISSIDSEMKTVRKSSRSPILAIIILMSMPVMANAQHDAYVDSLWNSAAEAYTEGRWNDAVDVYEMIGNMGLESAPLYCNTGSAYYKAGNVPMAILNYERALKVDPSYEDARYNIEFMRELVQDKIDPVPDFILAVWMKKISGLMDSDSWAISFLIFVGLFMAMLLIFILSRSVVGRKVGFYTGIVSLVFAVTSITFSLVQKRDYENDAAAIVMNPVVPVKSSPSSESSQNLFVLHEGTKVFIIDQVGSWYNIELADGRQGWVKSSEIENI